MFGLFQKFRDGLAKTHDKLIGEIKRIVTRAPPTCTCTRATPMARSRLRNWCGAPPKPASRASH